MANKYLKKLGLTIGQWVASGLSQDIAIDVFAQLSRRLGISSVVATGRSGRFEGHPDDLVSQYYIREKDNNPELQRLIDRCLGDGARPGLAAGRAMNRQPSLLTNGWLSRATWLSISAPTSA